MEPRKYLFSDGVLWDVYNKCDYHISLRRPTSITPYSEVRLATPRLQAWQEIILTHSESSMASEDAPLLVDHTNDVNRNDPYSRFSTAEKRTIVIVVSFVGLVPCK